MCEWLSVLLVVLATVAAAALAFHGFPGLADWLISALPFGENVKKAASGLPGGAAAQPLLRALILAFFAATLAFKARHASARLVFERWLDSFNTDVFDPIRQPAAQLAGDPALPWLAPACAPLAAARRRGLAPRLAAQRTL